MKGIVIGMWALYFYPSPISLFLSFLSLPLFLVYEGVNILSRNTKRDQQVCEALESVRIQPESSIPTARVLNYK